MSPAKAGRQVDISVSWPMGWTEIAPGNLRARPRASPEASRRAKQGARADLRNALLIGTSHGDKGFPSDAA